MYPSLVGRNSSVYPSHSVEDPTGTSILAKDQARKTDFIWTSCPVQSRIPTRPEMYQARASISGFVCIPPRRAVFDSVSRQRRLATIFRRKSFPRARRLSMAAVRLAGCSHSNPLMPSASSLGSRARAVVTPPTRRTIVLIVVDFHCS